MTAPEPDAGGEQSQILSVVVTIVDGGTTLERCVEALHRSYCKDKPPIPDKRTDKEKIQNAGFDKVTSFRNIK